MRKSLVRCQKIENWRGRENPDILYLAQSQDNIGFDLLSCLNCGHIYAVDISSMVYTGPAINKKLSEINCITCNSILLDTAEKYPDKYMSEGKIIEFDPPNEIPEDKDLVVISFDEIYS
jgi:hypothetical protein